MASRLIAIVIAVAMASCVLAAEQIVPKQLSGDYYVAGKTVHDSPASEPKDTHFRVRLEGESAKALWGAMKIAPMKWDCEPDAMFKIDKGLLCMLSAASEYECWFAINVAESRVEEGVGC